MFSHKKLATCCLDLRLTLFKINDGNKSPKILCLFMGNSKYEYKLQLCKDSLSKSETKIDIGGIHTNS